MIAPIKLTIDRPTRGLLYIGDPHVWSKCPGRRRDDNFLATVLGKIEQATLIANENDLWPICPGDLLHDDKDNDPVMLVNLVRTLQLFDRKMICLVGNHDKNEIHLSEKNSLLLLGLTDQLILIDKSGFAGLIPMVLPDGNQTVVAVGGTPYGEEIPTDIGKVDGAEQYRADQIVWMTHDDLAFQGAYPGARDIHEIKGVATCFNGHMHGTALPHKAGETAWYNPGNITRMSVDTMHHKPSVWAWYPDEREQMGTQQGLRVPLIHQHILNHVEGEHAFSLEGLHAPVIMPTQTTLEPPKSAFAQRLLADRIQARSDDGSFTRESLEEILAACQVSEPVQRILRELQENAARKISERE